MKNKRGSHVGIILSFVIFITFVVFVYSILQPGLKVEKEKEAALEYLKTNLLNAFKDNLIVVTVSAPAEISPPPICIRLNTNNFVGSKFIAKKQDDSIISAGDKVNPLNLNLDTFKVYFSNSINPTALGFLGDSCTLLEPNRVDINEEIFETKIKDSITDQNTFKQRFNLPEGNDFGFSFTDKEGAVINTIDNTPQGINIYTEEILIKYIDIEANAKYGSIVIRVW